jgi:lipopolysaccharide export system permease protein
MRILNRQRYWSFLKAYLICYVSLVGLYIVIDAFSNLDEFAKRAEGPVEIFQVMGRFYLIHQARFFDQLCGVITMMAAIFTVTWVQRNNELLAMLAAGISTQRVIRPVLISAVLVNGLAVANQELVMPKFAEELQRTHDDDGTLATRVSKRYDTLGIMIEGKDADRKTRSIRKFSATMRVNVFGSIRDLTGVWATYVPSDHPTAPIKGGWLVRGAKINPAVDDDMLVETGGLVTRVESTDGFPPCPKEGIESAGEVYFLRSSLTFDAMTRKPSWYNFATTQDLLDGLVDPSTDGSERRDIELFLHSRLLRPALGIVLMCMTLPLVLSGYGRNTFVNLGLALGNSALFYAVLIVTQSLGGAGLFPPAVAAWGPLIGFAALATFRWDRIRT